MRKQEHRETQSLAKILHSSVAAKLKSERGCAFFHRGLSASVSPKERLEFGRKSPERSFILWNPKQHFI